MTSKPLPLFSSLPFPLFSYPSPPIPLLSPPSLSSPFLPSTLPFSPPHTQERQKELTLQRRRSRQQLAGTEHAIGSEYADNAEFDELITALKTGAYFDTYARRRGKRNSGVMVSPRNSRLLEFSRERPPSVADSTAPLHEPY